MCTVGRYSHSLPQDLPSRAHCSATCPLGKAERRQLGTGPLLTASLMSSLEHQQKRISHAGGWLPFSSLAGKTLLTYRIHSFRPLQTQMKTPKQGMKSHGPLQDGSVLSAGVKDSMSYTHSNHTCGTHIGTIWQL